MKILSNFFLRNKQIGCDLFFFRKVDLTRPYHLVYIWILKGGYALLVFILVKTV